MYYYLVALVVSLAGLIYGDYKLKLALFVKPALATKILLTSIIFFLIWDIVGIFYGIFSTNQEFVSGLYFFTSDLPLEELLFLTLFSYVTLLTWRFVCIRTS